MEFDIRRLCLVWIFTIKIVYISARYLEQPTGDSLPCAEPRKDIVRPFLSTIEGQFVSNLNDYFSTRLLSEPIDLYPGEIFISFKWKNNILTLILYKNVIYGEETYTEWTDGDITYSEQTDEKCYYQGHVRSQNRSHVAVSLCQGVNGYIKTDKEEILIWPNGEETSSNRTLAHNTVSCIDKSISVARHSDENVRVRRQAPTTKKKYLEVLIAADTSVVNLVGKTKVKAYIMTIMNIVNMVYKDDSLGIDMDVITSKIVLMDKRAERSVVSSGDARRTVDKFCRWVAVEKYKKQYTGGINFDVAVFFTRTGIGPAGYAPITGLCNPTRSCAVVKDEGFTSAFIVAHEIAHVFGLMHDGHGNNCNGQEYQTAVMAATVQATLNHYWWSSCSRDRMQHLIPMLTCLNNNPLQSETVEVTHPLGTSWDIDEQCRYEFGTGHQACRTYHGDLCEMLWCNTKRNPRLCKTKRGRPLNGTGCGTDRWCMEGACTYYGGQPPRDGGYTEWSKWTACQQDCGFSIKTRSRKCENPRPAYGGKSCDGAYQEVDSCKSEACTLYVDHRAHQCTVLDVLPVRERRNTWLPYQTDDKSKQCKLTCMSNETSEIATFGDISVDDGTPCNYENPNHICVNGKCWESGCDGKRNSSLEFDDCGVCGGDGSNCKTVKGSFTKKMKYDSRARNYEEVTLLPVGARNINIKELATSAHFIGLMDPVYGTFVLGGNQQQSRTKQFAANGAWFEYENSWNFETLKSKGPLQRKLKLMIYPQNSVYKAALSYKYTITADDNTHQKELYEWRYKGWTDCSVTCGTGVQSIVYTCYDKNTGEQTDDEDCTLLGDPTGEPVKCTRMECNADIYRWAMSVDWSECTTTCGDSGVQHQLYSCERETQDGTTELVDMDMCSSLDTPKYTRNCNRISCKELENRWIMSSSWSDCSVTCGEGFEAQKFSCGKDTSSGAIDMVDLELCNHLKPPNNTRSCSFEPCIEYQWVLTENWSPCSETCGDNGVETQMFFCGTVDLDDFTSTGLEMCFDLQAPNITRSCNRVPCLTYRWVASDDWSKCTSTCGNSGVQYRMYNCMPNVSDTITNAVSRELCSDIDHTPAMRECNRQPCSWYKLLPSSNWTECSSTCGNDGTQYQLFTCVNETLNHDLNETLNHESFAVEMNFCGDIEIPSISKECNRLPCPQYKLVPMFNWTECTNTCGDFGVQHQLFGCVSESVNGDSINVDMGFCSQQQVPNISRECNRKPCDTFRWSPTVDWSDCSTTCGNNGVQHLRHECVVVISDNQTETVSNEYCNSTEQPVTSRVCNRGPCLLEWMAGGWSECSVTCGIGVQTREVICGDPFDYGDDHRCPGDPPSLTEICKRPDCTLNDHCQDRISICSRSATPRKCQYRGYKSMCCASCRDLNNIFLNDFWYK